MRHLGPLPTLAVLVTLGCAGVAVSAPITFNTALPVGKGEFVFREQFVLDQSGPVNSFEF